MDEEWWLACSDPLKMLDFLRGKASYRKRRLFAVTCARRVWQFLRDERSRKAVVISERYADKYATDEEIKAAGHEGKNAAGDTQSAARNLADEAARYAAFSAFHAASCAYHAGYCNDWSDIRISSEYAVWACRKVDLFVGEDAERLAQCQILRDLFGNLFHPITISSVWLSWNDGIVVRLAQAAYDDRILPAGTLDNARLFILADALEEAGCTDEQILTHLRSGGDHYRGCWVIDLLLGRE
jgi:hypothetical protein